MKKILSLAFLFIITFTLVSCANGDKKKLEEAKENLEFIDVNLKQVTNSFELYSEGYNGSTITWTSEEPSVGFVRTVGDITSLVVDRPLKSVGNKTFKITAEIKIGKSTTTKDFEITVLAWEEEIAEVASIAKAVEIGTDGKLVNENKKVMLKNVTVVNVDSDAYYVTDGTQVTLVYTAPKGIEVGDKGTLIGTPGIYYDGTQIGEGANFVSREKAELPTPKAVELSSLWLPRNATSADIKAAKIDVKNAQLISFEALVLKRSDFTGGANYQLTFVGKNSEGNYDINSNFALSYYKGLNDEEGKGELHKLNGKVVKFTATIRELRDNRATTAGVTQPVWSLSIATIGEQTNPNAESQVVVDSIMPLTTDFVKEGTITLPKTGAVFSSTLAWSLVDPTQSSLINVETGKVTPVAGERTEVQIKVVATKDGKTAEQVYTIFVGDYVDVTIGKYLSAEIEKGSTFRVEGVVTFIEDGSYKNFYITDASGKSIYVRPDKAEGLSNVKVGNKVKVTGAKDVFNGLVQVKGKVITFVSKDNTVAEPVVVTTQAEALAAISKLVKITGVVKSVNGRSMVVTVGTVDFALRTNSGSKTFDETLVGKNVTVTSIMTYFNGAHSGNAQGNDATKVQINIDATSQVKVNA